MDKPSQFRGLAGEVVVGICHPASFLLITMVAAYLFFWIAPFVIVGAISKRAEGIANLSILTGSIALARVIGMFAIAAMNGDLKSGFFSPSVSRDELRSFTLRYLGLIFGGNFVIFFLAYLVSEKVALPNNFESGLIGTFFFSARGMCSGVLVCTFFLVNSLAAILVLSSESLSELTSGEFWSEKILQRIPDLVVYYSSVMGATLLFLCIYFIPFCVIGMVAFSASLKLGLIVTWGLSLLPSVLAPVLVGRLSGTFVAGDNEMDFQPAENRLSSFLSNTAAEPSRSADISAAFLKPQTPKEVSPAAAAFGKPDPFRPAEVIRRIQEIPPEDFQKEFDAVAERLAKNAREINSLFEALLLSRKLNQTEQAQKFSVDLISLALQRGVGAAAVLGFRTMSGMRHQLPLTAAQQKQLAGYLVRDGHFEDGGLLYHEAFANGESDPVSAQKRLLEVAEAAIAAEKKGEAASLLELFLRLYPDSNFLDYAKKLLLAVGKNYPPT